jgi:methylenetetrahydrofolate--tRNA-(uracil-5-)-methyltransferase
MVYVVGAGLAGSECAWQLAQMGFEVELIEMRSKEMTPAHHTDKFAELVCSNSFGSMSVTSATAQLKWEAKQLNSLILACAHKAYVPAGQALGVDRELFSELVTTAIKTHPKIKISNRTVNS